jgi:hypothetical protein
MFRRQLLARDLGLALLGVASLAVYAWLLGSLTWINSSTYTPVREAVAVPWWLDDPEPRPEVTPDVGVQLHAAAAAEFAVAITVLYVLYLLSCRVARGRWSPLGVAAVLGFGAAFQALAALAPYSFSGDVYSYAIYGRISGVYGASPYLEVPAQYPGDPFFDYVFWKFVPSFYGPLWTLLSGAVALIAGPQVGLAVLVFRLIAAASAVGASLVAFAVVRHFDPERALKAATLIAWCPFVVIECGLGAHNDALMAFLVLLSVGLAWHKRAALSVAALVMAGLVKLSALALLPLLGLYFLRVLPDWPTRIRAATRSAVGALLLSWVIILPVWSGPETFAVGTLGSGADRYVNSLAETALGELRVAFGESREALEVPLNFSGWWVATHTEAILYADRALTESIRSVQPWTSLLVVGPEREHRVWVYDPESRAVGFIEAEYVGPVGPPPDLLEDPEVAAKVRGPLGTWQLAEANRVIRGVGWGAFVLAYLVALVFGTGSPARLTAAWAGMCVVLCVVTLTWFWPWYVLWGLLPAALIPRSRLMRLTVLVSWGVLLVYVGLGFADTSAWFLNSYRAVGMFGLPLLVFVADDVLRALVWTGRGLLSAARTVRQPVAAPAVVGSPTTFGGTGR